MIRNGIYEAETDEERDAVFRFRYAIYVKEMARYGASADHERGMLVEAEDETARIFCAVEEGEVVATSRFSWGGDAPFTHRLVEHYMLEPFIAELPADVMAVGERGMVKPELRGTPIFTELGYETMRFIQDRRIQLIFGACEPHLLSRYVGQGSRTFSHRNINSAEAGYLIPIVNVVEDVDYLRRIGSPRASTVKDWGEDARIPECVKPLIENGGNVMSQRLVDSGVYLDQVHESLDELAENKFSILDGLDAEQTLRALGRSSMIQCSAGDQVIKKGGTARNLFVVLEGHLEVRDGDKLLSVFSPGDVFGEMAFLLDRPRTADVYAATDGRVLSLSEGTLRKSIDSDSQVAAHLMLNVAKILCTRILLKG